MIAAAPSVSDYAMSRGALLFGWMLETGRATLLDDVEDPVNYTNCRDTVARAYEHDWIVIEEEEEEPEDAEFVIIVQMVSGLLGECCGIEHEDAVTMACEAILEAVDADEMP